MKRVFFLLDLEADGGIYSNNHRTYEAIDTYLSQVKRFFIGRDIPIACFVEGRLLRERADIVDSLKDLDINYYSHAYDHSYVYSNHSQQIYNIAQGLEVFKNFFQQNATAFRAPNSIISPEIWSYLMTTSVKLDLSLVPSYFPTRFNFLQYDKSKYNFINLSIKSVSTITPFKIPCGLSFFQLLGTSLTQNILAYSKLPDDLFIYFHFHDLLPESFINRLEVPLFTRVCYLKNTLNDGLNLLNIICDILSDRGYSFNYLECVISDEC